MAARYDRKNHAANITTMAQVALAWHEEDAQLRGGRKSWSGDQYERDILTEVLGRRDKARASRDGLSAPAVSHA